MATIYETKATGLSATTEPSKRYMYLVCGEAITKGNVVRWAVAGEGTAPYNIEALATDTDRSTHANMGGILIMVSDANYEAVGIATETGAIGDVIKVQTRGRGDVNITTGQAMAAHYMLYAGAAGATAEAAMDATIDGGLLIGIVGIGLDDDATAVGYANTYIITTIGGW